MKRKFVYDPETKEMVEVDLNWESPPRDQSELLWNDRSYIGLKATDGTPIDSRAKHRAYMKANGLTTMDDFKGEWATAEKSRADYYQGRKGSVTRNDIEQAIHQLQGRKR